MLLCFKVDNVSEVRNVQPAATDASDNKNVFCSRRVLTEEKNGEALNVL